MASRRQLEAERRSDAVDIIDRPKLNDAASSNLTESHRAKQAVPMDLSKQEGRLFHIKVTSIAIRESKSDDKNTKDAAINMLPLATLDFKGANVEKFKAENTLETVRSEIDKLIQGNKQLYKFCTEDCSTVADNLSLGSYLTLLRAQTANTGNVFQVYVTAFTGPAATASSALSTPPFMIKFIQGQGNSALTEGSLHSSAFDGKDAAKMRLSEIRKLVKKMSQDPEMHTFCSSDNTAVGDELSLGDYLKLDDEEVTQDSGVFSIIVRFRKAGSAKALANPSSKSASKFHGASQEVLAMMEQMKPDLSFRVKQYTGRRSSSTNGEKDRSQDELKMDTSDFKVQEELSASSIAAHDANPAKFTAQMDENDWEQVMKNCCLLYGWRIDKKTNKVVQATTPAFRLRSNIAVSTLPPEDVANEPKTIQDPAQTIQTPPSSNNSDGRSDSESEVGSGPFVPTTQESLPTTAENIRAKVHLKPSAIPSYAISDDSKIEITTVSHEFQKSMAENHFSATSIEASVSGGYAGFSVGVSGGMSSEKGSGKTKSSKAYTKTMFPRVSVFLRPEDVEPTSELQNALALIRKSKNINALRKLHATFGHLFCLEAKLGGCLQTTKIVTGTEQSAQTMEKEGFKASVGLAVSTPIGIGASMKASRETQDKKETSEKTTDTSEAMVFEATGGNTILAADPPAWSSSVADFQNWRVIDRGGLSPLVDVIAQIPRYGDVKAWFFQAVPKLSEYIIIPESRILAVRFKAIADNLLSIGGKAETAYLGHDPDPDKAPRPIRTLLERNAPTNVINERVTKILPWGESVDLTTVTTQVDVTTKDTMFFPHSTQAPVLMYPGLAESDKADGALADNGRALDVVSNDAVGTVGDATLMHTVWRLEVPEKFSLGSDCLVCIKSLANPSSPMGLTVYRNQQGVFLPGLTSMDEPSYWRIEKVESSTVDTRIKDGNEIRLCWRFSDQVAGFRDYYDDVYGRRRFQRPAECEHDSIYLKMPYPRFENVKGSAGIAMVMSHGPVKAPLVQALRVLPRKGEVGEQVVNYSLHDVRFRLDSVGNDGLGDAGDYMNIITAARTQEYQNNVTLNTQHRESVPSFADKLQDGSPESVVAGVILGPLAAPVAGLATVLDSIFGF